MVKDAYLKVKHEVEAKEKFTKHMRMAKTCRHLKLVLNKIIFAKRDDEEFSLKELAIFVKNIRFQKYRDEEKPEKQNEISDDAQVEKKVV